MSRIGNAPISVPKGVTVTTSGRTISAKGPQGNLSFEVPPKIDFEHAEGVIRFKRPGNSRTERSMHGMARARTMNIVKGVSEGFRRELEINGVGYRAAVKGQSIDLTLGFSHPLPKDVKAEVTKEGRLIITGPDKVAVGRVAADIRRYRPPEPYKGKGVKFLEETINRKEGKRGKK
jgi:large subunit ribosomal protein L6